jgi:hypothetical protein
MMFHFYIPEGITSKLIEQFDLVENCSRCPLGRALKGPHNRYGHKNRCHRRETKPGSPGCIARQFTELGNWRAIQPGEPGCIARQFTELGTKISIPATNRIKNLKLGCLHPVACVRSSDGGFYIRLRNVAIVG